MRGLSKKMLISLLTSVVVFVTMIATTFAWVGIFTYANTDSFKMNLKVNKASNYYLTISGIDSKNYNDYSDHVPLNILQKQILDNWDITYKSSADADEINGYFQLYNEQEPSTPYYTQNGNISCFKKIINLSQGHLDYVETSGIIKFDVYLTVNTLEGIDEETSGINSNVVLDEIQKTLQGVINVYTLTNGNSIRNNKFAPSGFDWKLYEAHKSLSSIITVDGKESYVDKKTIRTDSSSAARFALEVYNPIKLTDTYTGEETPINTIVYQGGSALPTYDEATDVYSMGGILPEEYNYAVQEARSLYGRILTIPEQTKDYESKVRCLSGSKRDNTIWESPEYDNIDTDDINYLGVMNGIQTKQKITIYFWFEGWDSDCTWVIDKKNVTLNLTFTADIDN